MNKYMKLFLLLMFLGQPKNTMAAALLGLSWHFHFWCSLEAENTEPVNMKKSIGTFSSIRKNWFSSRFGWSLGWLLLELVKLFCSKLLFDRKWLFVCVCKNWNVYGKFWFLNGTFSGFSISKQSNFCPTGLNFWLPKTKCFQKKIFF